MKRDESLIENFKVRNIEVEYFDSVNLLNDKLDNMIPADCTVGIGHSKTLEKINITNHLLDRGNNVYDKTLGKTNDEVNSLKKKALISDWYITGSNAVSEAGHIVNIDHSGNRVASMHYGPEKVLIIVGKNKVVPH